MGIFSYDSKLFRTLNQIMDCVLISVLWFISSIPVITIGASTTALYHTVDKVIRREEGQLWKEYWRVFRRDFKRATGLWLIIVLICGILAANFFLAFYFPWSGKSLQVFLQIVVVFVTAFLAIWMQYWFPYLVRFDDPVKKILKNTMAIMTSETKTSMRLLFLFLLVAALDLILSLRMPVLTLAMPVAYIISLNRILERLFARYIAQQEEITQ